MGSSCSSSCSTIDHQTAATEYGGDKSNPVPYIIVSSVSLSKRIAEENMHLSVGKMNSLTIGHTKTGKPQLSILRNAIVLEDESRGRRFAVDVANASDIAYLSLHSDQLGQLESKNTKCWWQRRSKSLPVIFDNEVGSIAQFLLHNSVKIHHLEDVPQSETKNTCKTARSDDTEAYVTTEPEEFPKPSATLINTPSIGSCLHLQGDEQPSDVSSRPNGDMKDCTEQTSPSPPNLRVHVNDDNCSHENVKDETTLKEIIQSKLELLTLYAPMMGAFMLTRKEIIAEEVLDIYTKVTHRHVYDREQAKVDLISNIDSIQSYEDIRHFVL